MGLFLAVSSVVAACLLVIYFLPRLRSYWRYLAAAEKLPAAKGRILIFGNALQVAVPQNQLVAKVEEMHKSNKSLFVGWAGPIPFLVVVDPKYVEVFLGSVKHIEKIQEYHFFESWLGQGLVTSKGSRWTAHRKMLTPAFHFKILENFIDSFIENSKILIKNLEKEVGSASFDAMPYVSMCILDIICATAMGINGHAQGMKQHSEYLDALTRITADIMYRAFSPWLYPDFIFNLTPNGRRFAKDISTLHQKTYQIINERREQYRLNLSRSAEEEAELGRKKRLVFLDLLLENSEKGMKLTDEEIREEVDTFMLGGHDTVSSLVSWALQLLSSYPDVQEKVYEEQESIFKGSDRDPSIKDLCEMKYLERVIKETLRLYPSVYVFAREVGEDVQLGEHRVPAGMRVLIVPYLTHRLEEYYPNPKVFDPDRFLPEKIVNRHPYSFIPFSAGPRNCIGQKFAMLEMKTVLSYVIRHYKLQATGEIPAPVAEIVLRPENGVQIKIFKRRDSSA
nr:cytochrome P450 4PC subfamily member 1 [Blattella germanica]